MYIHLSSIDYDTYLSFYYTPFTSRVACQRYVSPRIKVGAVNDTCGNFYMCIIPTRTVGGDKLILDPRRSWGPVLECRRIGRPLPGVAPGELAQDGAIRILGVIRVLSDRRLLVNVLPTRRKLLSLADDEVNHPPNIAKQPSDSIKSIFETRDIEPPRSPPSRGSR